MSIFDLFRGFFGVPGGHRREPFFDGLTHEDDDDEEDGFHHEYFDRFNDVHGFSFGSNGIRIREPQMFGQLFQEMEEMFSGLGHFGRDFPSIAAPPEEGSRKGGRSRSSLRDFMLKNPDDAAPRDVDPSSPGGPSLPQSPFPRFKSIWSDEPRQREEEKKVDGDLDSQVSSGGLDQILQPTPSQPWIRSFYKSVTVTKVVKPDGTVEERRTVKDGRGNEETTVTRSGGPGGQEGPHHEPASPTPGGSGLSFDMREESSFFSKFFGGFRS